MKDRLTRTNSRRISHRIKNALLSCSIVAAIAAVCLTVYAISEYSMTQSYGKVVEKYDIDIEVEDENPVVIGG